MLRCLPVVIAQTKQAGCSSSGHGGGKRRGGHVSTLCWFDLPLRSANLAFERRLIMVASARTSIAASYAGSLSFRSPAQSNPRSRDKAPYAGNILYFARRNVRVSPEPNYCLAKLVGTRNYGIVGHINPLAFEENAVMIVLDVPFTVLERMTIGSSTAIKPVLVLQRLKPSCNGSPVHLPVGSRIRTTAAANKRANFISLRPPSPHPNTTIAIGVFDLRQNTPSRTNLSPAERTNSFNFEIKLGGERAVSSLTNRRISLSNKSSSTS
jgi:hypothetical protein